MDKPQLKYRVVSGRNPKTGGVLLRPIIVDRETYDMDQLVEYALNAGYVRGQFHDMRGALNGFVEAMQPLGKAGKAVNLNNWHRIHAELTGTVGDTRQLTDTNELHVAITALTDLKAKVSDFSWSNIESGATIKVENVSSPNGTAGEQSETHLHFDWQEALADVPVDTELTFSFRLHGAEGVAEQVSVRVANLVAA